MRVRQLVASSVYPPPLTPPRRILGLSKIRRHLRKSRKPDLRWGGATAAWSFSVELWGIRTLWSADAFSRNLDAERAPPPCGEG
ncbi:hypothetical protein CHELA40_13689 [Chelatococcus asaccharovorans]|nr:hypothetical protein CHELA40_13689 [Chelatococcus asaccharovorans]CAH1676310.1 hypothetical protein CHELA17_61936 [Chelatococcus asaccharovorans]